MFAVVELRRSRDESPGAGSAHIGFKNFVGIIKVARDEIETREGVSQLRGQLGVSREKTGKRWGFKRTNRIGVETSFGECGDVFDAEDFEVRVGKAIAQ